MREKERGGENIFLSLKSHQIALKKVKIIKYNTMAF